MRLDQDINFEAGGVPCVMRLDTTAMDAVKGDLWIIRPRDPVYVEVHPETRETQFAVEISDVLEKLEWLDPARGIPRELRQQYDWRSYDDHAYLQVEDEGVTLACGIEVSLPDWDGDSFDFLRSERLARLLADLKEAVPDIKFTRSDGTTIEYEKFVEHGGNQFAKMMDALDKMTDEMMGH